MLAFPRCKQPFNRLHSPRHLAPTKTRRFTTRTRKQASDRLDRRKHTNRRAKRYQHPIEDLRSPRRSAPSEMEQRRIDKAQRNTAESSPQINL